MKHQHQPPAQASKLRYYSNIHALLLRLSSPEHPAGADNTASSSRQATSASSSSLSLLSASAKIAGTSPLVLGIWNSPVSSSAACRPTHAQIHSYFYEHHLLCLCASYPYTVLDMYYPEKIGLISALLGMISRRVSSCAGWLKSKILPQNQRGAGRVVQEVFIEC